MQLIFINIIINYYSSIYLLNTKLIICKTILIIIIKLKFNNILKYFYMSTLIYLQSCYYTYVTLHIYKDGIQQ